MIFLMFGFQPVSRHVSPKFLKILVFLSIFVDLGVWKSLNVDIALILHDEIVLKYFILD